LDERWGSVNPANIFNPENPDSEIKKIINSLTFEYIKFPVVSLFVRIRIYRI
jgi:hypothetical protein